MEINQKQFALLCFMFANNNYLKNLEKFFEKAKILDMGFDAFLTLNQGQRNRMHHIFESKNLSKPEIMIKNPVFYFM